MSNVNPELHTPEDYSGMSAYDRMPNTCGEVYDALFKLEVDLKMALTEYAGKPLDNEVLRRLSHDITRLRISAQGQIVDKVTKPFRKALVLTTREREQARAATAYWKKKAVSHAG